MKLGRETHKGFIICEIQYEISSVNSTIFFSLNWQNIAHLVEKVQTNFALCANLIQLCKYRKVPNSSRSPNSSRCRIIAGGLTTFKQ